MRIVSWNINSVRARLPLIEKFLQRYKPDILCLQEIKVSSDAFPSDWFNKEGYIHQAVNGQRMYHGVAILSKFKLNETVTHDWQGNGEARHIGVTLPKGLRLENVYIPAGGDNPNAEENPKFKQKIDYMTRLTRWSAGLDRKTILLGDFNIAPLPTDVWDHKNMSKVVSHTPVEIAHLEKLQQSHNWIDLGRHFTPADMFLFTWWSYRARNWQESNKGRRLDHIWVSPGIETQISNCQVALDARGWDKPSDHAPVIVDFQC